MASFDAVNYSLRPNKTIQRGLVFDGLVRLADTMPWDEAIYVGLGSIWFTDFVLAHKRLGLNRMISIESDPIGYSRAVYNQPFRTVQVLKGLSYELVPAFYEDGDMIRRPWIIWLDYDFELGDDAVDELRGVLERAPDDSVLLTTVDASAKRYGRDPKERQTTLSRLLGDVVPDRIPNEALNGTDAFASTLARLFEAFLASAAENGARPGRWVPAFRLPYRDKAAMVTVGGILASPRTVVGCRQIVASSSWPCQAPRPITVPHLTLRELAVLQAQLPSEAKLDRAAVQALGFDLGEDQIDVFQRYYKYYPAFAQISA